MGSTKINTGLVVANTRLCRAHYRLSMRVSNFAPSRPGQFVNLRPPAFVTSNHNAFLADAPWDRDAWRLTGTSPMLRRAFSIAGLRTGDGDVELDVIYRVVGRGTTWLSSLGEGSTLSVLGPLGLPFPIHRDKRQTWMVAGGVGLPPMLWLSQALHHAGKRSIAFCGAQTADLLALTMDEVPAPSRDASVATLSSTAFAGAGTPVVISTDDGSLGFAGHIGAALAAYHQGNPCDVNDLVVYTCGPERMMGFVADYCLARGIECHVCMERSMACGTGMCQSCVVPLRDAGAEGGWRYKLCCREGPVFDARDVLWEEPVVAT